MKCLGELVYQINGKTVSMFSVYTSGQIFLNYTWLASQVDAAMIQGFHKAITAIPGFDHIPADFNKWPSVKIENVFLNKPTALAQFKEVVEEFGKHLV